MPTINWQTKVISVLQSELTLISAGLYELDVNAFRLALKDIEDTEEGMAFLATHRHNTEVTLSGVTYARTFEIINGYTVSFQNTGTPYRVRCVGANHNIADVTNFDGGMSLIVGNSAGLVVTGSGVDPWATVLEGGLTSAEMMRIIFAMAANKSAGGGTTTITFRDKGDSKNRIVATVDSQGNRTAVTVDGS